MGLIEQARQDIADITQNLNDFGIQMVLTAPDATTATVTGLHTRHHLGVDTDGNMVNSRNVHVSISEAALIASGYTYRNADNEVDLKNHRVTAADSSGEDRHYKITQWHQDETVGLIVIILGDYE